MTMVVPFDISSPSAPRFFAHTFSVTSCLQNMSSLYLCRDCSGAFHSLEQLQSHEAEEHNGEGGVVEMMNEEAAMEEKDENEQVCLIWYENSDLNDTGLHL